MAATDMVAKALVAALLVAFSVAVHAGGLALALRWLRRLRPLRPAFWRSTWLFIRVAGLVLLLHVIEITVWAVAYVSESALDDLPSALYFSAVTYTTTGYGDVVLSGDWRLVGAVEALTGILMCGWSTGFFFAVVSRLHEKRPHPGNTVAR